MIDQNNEQPPSNPAGPAASQQSNKAVPMSALCFSGRHSGCRGDNGYGEKCGCDCHKQPAEPPSEKAKDELCDAHGPWGCCMLSKGHAGDHRLAAPVSDAARECISLGKYEVNLDSGEVTQHQPAEVVSEAWKDTNKIMLSLGNMGVLDYEAPSQSNSAWDGMLEDIQAAITAATAAQQAEIAALREERDRAQNSGNALYETITRRMEPHFPAGDRGLDWDVLPSTINGVCKERNALRAELATTRERLAKCEADLTEERRQFEAFRGAYLKSARAPGYGPGHLRKASDAALIYLNSHPLAAQPLDGGAKC